MYNLIFKNFGISFFSVAVGALVNLIVSGEHLGNLYFWFFVFGWTFIWTVYDLFKKPIVKDINND
jgi:hypothetical protein